MADDPTGAPKPPARRRRGARSSAPSRPTVVPETGDEPATDTDPMPVGSVEVEPVVATDGGSVEAAATVATVWPLLDGRSPNEWVCPFLRSTDDQDHLDAPVESPDAINRCAALEDVVPQSLRQQELVCLTAAHVNCPRYLRGAVVAVDPAAAKARKTPTMTPAMLGALGILAAAFTASVVFTFARGGLDLPVAARPGTTAPSSSAIAVVPSASPSATASVLVSAAPSTSAAPSDTPMPSTSPTAEPNVSLAPSPPPSPTPTATPIPSSNRYALLTACPGKPDCWLYRVRSGDNLFSIAKYFGIPLATVKSLNPWTASGLKVGRDLVLPPPTR